MFHHNVMDIVSLACLTHVVLPTFSAPEQAALDHGADLLGLARWLRRAGDHETAATLYRKAIHAGMADQEMFAALWEAALTEKKRGRHDCKIELLLDLAQARNAFQAKAAEEAAKHFERCEKDFERALELARTARELEPSEELTRRCARLERRIARAAGASKTALFNA